MKCKNLPVTENIMQEIIVTKVETAGCILCCPKTSDDNVDLYLEFLAALNTKYEQKKDDGTIFAPEVGQVCACYTAVGDSENKLWYRGKVICLFNSPGFIAKVLLVDVGKYVCVTRARMRQLSEEFVSFPHQVMKCTLNNIVPITLGSNVDLSTSLQKSHHWDSAANRYMEDLVKDAQMYMETTVVDNKGTHLIVLYKKRDNEDLINVNELLVKETFATWKHVGNDVLRQQNINTYSPVDKRELITNRFDVAGNNVSCATPTPNRENITSSNNLNVNNTSPSPSHTALVVEQYQRDRQAQKKEQQKRIKEHANKDCEELLRLLNDDHTLFDRSAVNSGDSTAELSDMECTPVPKMTSYKNVQSARNPMEMLNEKLGKEATDILARGLGMTEEEYPTKTSKRVSFSSHSEVLGPNFSSASNDADTPLKPFDFIDSNTTFIRKGNGANMVDTSYLLKALAVGAPPLKLSAQFKTSTGDVLVSGKLKREPFRDLGDLNLPLPIRTSLKELNFQAADPFQLHMWPALMASRNVVGIADTCKNNTPRILSYMLPLLKSLISPGVKQNLTGKGNGPLIVICVGGWSEAQQVYDICELLTLYFQKSIRVDIRYGGMDNVEERNIRLINGCEILISTVPSLNKMVEAGYTNLNRLSHIVFDNCDLLVEKFTDDIKVLMRQYAENIKKQNREKCQIISIGMKWSYGIHSLTSSYIMDPLVIIANKIEATLYAKVPFVVELCTSCDRLDSLIGLLETDAANENTIVFTNSAKSAEDLQKQLFQYSLCCDVLTEFHPPIGMKDIKSMWHAASQKRKNNLLIISDNAVLSAGIKNATCVVHYDFAQKKSDFGNRLNCLLDSIRENENKDTKKELTSHVFVTEQDNGMRYSTGLVKLLKRSGQHVPAVLKTMATASRELKEEQKMFYELCPRLKLFGECNFIEDCQERHRIFIDKDLLGLCPSTGFIKVIILDVISASNFWGRIIEHRLPYDPNHTAYDTTLYVRLSMDLQFFYSNPVLRKKCCTAEKYDVCVINTIECGYQRVRIEDIVEKDLERPKKLKVFGIDAGFTKVVSFDELMICEEKFINISPQAVEIIACCVKPTEKGISWTHEASCYIEKSVLNRTLEGRVQFSLQNTIWVDPLVEKEELAGIKTKAYRIDVGRDLLQHGFAEKNLSHVDNLRKLLYDVQGHPIPLSTAKQSLPLPMVEHDSAYLQDDDYEEVYVSSVSHPGLFFVQRMEQCKAVEKLDDKIDATMAVTKINIDIADDTFPIGYVCVAQYSVDKRWYRAKVLGVSGDQLKYDIFFVDHGDRQWISKSKVYPASSDILALPFQAIQCSFNNITPISREWNKEDGDALWDLVEDKLLYVKVLKTTASSYVCDTVSYEIELCDTTGEQNKNISHELVYMGVAHGSLQCLQEIFPHASVNKDTRVYGNDIDKCPDLCVEIHLVQDLQTKIEKAGELQSILFDSPQDGDVIIENGAVQSLCSLLALCKQCEVQEVLLQCLQHVYTKHIRCREVISDQNMFKVLCDMLKKAFSDHLKESIVSTLMTCASDPWYHHVLHNLGLMKTLCTFLHSECDVELLKTSLKAIAMFCYDNESNCASFRQEEGLKSLCGIFQHSKDEVILEYCAKAFHSLLFSLRNQDHIRDIGGLSILSTLSNKQLNEKALKSTLESLLLCINNNETNKEYLFKIKAHEHLQRCAILPLRYSMAARKLFNDVITKIKSEENANAPADRLHQLKQMEEREMMHKLENECVDDDIITTTLAPNTAWSQRRNTVTISIQLRGVRWEETDIQENSLKFRTVLNRVEYSLDIELYDKVCVKESRVLLKGGEVLLILRKEKLGDIWPRLMKTNEKPPYIRIDFDRWVDEYPEHDSNTTEEEGTFLPGLPKPPPCRSYKFSEARLPTLDSSSNGGESSDENEDEEDEDVLAGYTEGTRDDYFKL